MADADQDPDPLKVVVTGGAGFIGGNFCRLLVERGVDVVVVDDLSTGSSHNLTGLDVDLRVGSILDRELLLDACAGAGSVVHLAARASVPLSVQDPEATHRVNVSGTVHVLEAARRHGCHVVVASSAAVYGDDPTSLKAEHLAPRPLSPYAASKLATEAYALAYQRSYDMPTMTFRFFNVFGPLQRAEHVYAAVVPAFVSAALEGRALTVYGDGHQTRDFVYVGTVAALLRDVALDRRRHAGPVNLAFGTRTSLLDLIALLEREVGRPLPRTHQPVRPGDIVESRGDDALLRTLFPAVQPAPLRDGLAATVAWYRTALPRRGDEN